MNRKPNLSLITCRYVPWPHMRKRHEKIVIKLIYTSSAHVHDGRKKNCFEKSQTNKWVLFFCSSKMLFNLSTAVSITILLLNWWTCVCSTFVHFKWPFFHILSILFRFLIKIVAVHTFARPNLLQTFIMSQIEFCELGASSSSRTKKKSALKSTVSGVIK